MFAGDCKDAAAARKDGLLTTYASIEPCRAYLAGVVWYAVCCRTSRAPPHPRTGSLSQARYSMRVPAVHCSSVHSGGTARWSPSLAGSRSRRRRVPQARRPSCGRWSRWRCGPRRPRVAQGEAAGRCPRRSARAVSRGALLAGGAQGEGVHAGRGHGRQHRHHPRGLSRGQGAVAQARATRVRGQASLLHAARGRDAHHRK
mmetsp:Transcript_33524/g.110844  ORF Transcript_33524/g.110844 Transcript_33524/m.110844 type:complete len:201 (-) Transcript_33524:209-811(-)